MFKYKQSESKDKNGIKYMPDGIPALTFPNTKGWEQPTHWAHPKGSGLNPEDYPELEPSFYEDTELKLRVQKPYYQNAMRTLQNRAANAPAAPAGMSSASQTAPCSAGQSTDQDEWTVGRVASQIWDGLTDPRLAEGAKTAAKYGLIGAGIGAASIGASATAGLAGAGLLPSVASGAGSALTGTAARIGAAGAAGASVARRGGQAAKSGYNAVKGWVESPQGQNAIGKASDFIDGMTPGVPPTSPSGYYGGLTSAGIEKIKEKMEE